MQSQLIMEAREALERAIALTRPPKGRPSNKLKAARRILAQGEEEDVAA